MAPATRAVALPSIRMLPLLMMIPVASALSPTSNPCSRHDALFDGIAAVGDEIDRGERIVSGRDRGAVEEDVAAVVDTRVG